LAASPVFDLSRSGKIIVGSFLQPDDEKTIFEKPIHLPNFRSPCDILGVLIVSIDLIMALFATFQPWRNLEIESVPCAELVQGFANRRRCGTIAAVCRG
jgi:hypothetical protein